MSSRDLTIALYAGLACVLAGMALVARRRPDVVAPVSRVVRAAARTRSGQLLLVLSWWWLGWHFVLAS